MADSAYQAWVEVLPDFKEFNRKASSGINSSLGDAGRSSGAAFGASFSDNARGGVGDIFKGNFLADIARDAGQIIGASIKAGVDFGLKGIDLASSLSEQANAIKVAYGDAGDSVGRLVEGLAGRLNLSRLDFSKSAVKFSAFSKTIAGDGGDVTQVLEDLTRRGADFASVYDVEVGDALQLFQSGLAGETEPLRAYGIDLSAAAVNAYALKAGISDGTRELTEAEKVQARYGALLEQTNITEGDLANTRGSLANQQRELNVQLEEAQTKFGEQLLPTALDVITFANEDLLPILSEALDKVGPVLSESLEDALPKIKETVNTLADGLPGAINIAFDGADSLADLLDEEKGIPGVVRNLQGFADFLTTDIGSTEDYWDRVGRGWTNFWLNIQDDTDKTRVEIQADSEAIKSHWKSTLDQMRADTAAAASGGHLLGAQFAQGFADGIQTQEETVALAAERIALAARNKVRGTLQIQSPSKVGRELGGYFSEGFALGIGDNLSMVEAASVSMSDISVGSAAQGGSSGGMFVGAFAADDRRRLEAAMNRPVEVVIDGQVLAETGQRGSAQLAALGAN